MRLIIGFLLALVAVSVNAATYYVSSSGNDSNVGSEAEPWADISVSAGKLSSGDTLLLKRGDTFIETSIVSITDANITLGCYGSGAAPIWSGNDWTEPGNYNDGGLYSAQVQFGTYEGDNRANGGTVECIHFLRPGGMHIKVYSDNVTVQNTIMEESFIQSVVAYNFASGTKLLNNTVIDGVYGYENRDSFSGFNPCSGCWGASVANKGDNTLIEGNTVSSFGESINSNCGATDFIIRGNTVYGGMVGIYSDVVQNGLIEDNIVYRVSSNPRYATGIGFNIEPNCLRKTESAGLNPVMQNVVVRNNLVAGFKNGLWWADEAGMRDEAPDAVMSGIYVYNNTFIDNERQINFFGGINAGSWIKNNIFHTFTSPSASGMINGVSNAVSLPTIDTNYFTQAPPSGDTNSVIGGIDLVKETGWRAAAEGGISASDFEAEGSSTTFNAGLASLGNGQTYVSDYYGNAVSGTPNLGAFEGGYVAPPAGGDSSISSITGDALTASSWLQANGSELNGAFYDTSLATDSDSDEGLLDVYSAPAGLIAHFRTDALTGIDSDPLGISMSVADTLYATETFAGWAGNFTGSVDITEAADNWIFTNGKRIATSTGSVGQAWETPNIALTSGTPITVEIRYKAGTSNDLRAYWIDGNSDYYRFRGAPGTLNNATPDTTNTGTAHSNFAEYAIPGTDLYRGVFTFTPDVTGDHRFGIGPDSTTAGQDVIAYSVRVWEDRATNAAQVTYDLPVQINPTLTDLNGNEVLASDNTGTGTNLYPLSGTIDTVDLGPIWFNAAGTSVQFESPDLSALSTGSKTLTLRSAVPTAQNTSTASWLTNTTTAVTTAYSGNHLGYTGGTRLAVGSGGPDWTAFKLDDFVSANAGDNLTVFVDLVQQQGGRVRVGLTNLTAGGFIDPKGVFGALETTGTSACSNSTITEEPFDGAWRIKIACTVASTGSFRLTIGPDSATEGDAVAALGAYANVNPVLEDATLGVNYLGSIDVTPTAKSIVYPSQLTINGTAYTGTLDSVTVYSAFPWTGEVDLDTIEVAQALDVDVAAGAFTLTEGSLSSGSINALLPATDYWIVPYLDVGGDNHRALARKVQITLE